ncbi:hypothetical protein ACVDFE_31710 [Lentzea chajnantorensis]
MGSNWSWTLVLPEGTWDEAAVERLLALADGFGLSPLRPGGGINGFDKSPGREGDHRVVDRAQLVQGLVSGSFATNLWTASEVDVWLSTGPGGADDSMSMSLDSVHCRRTPVADADPFRELHRALTELWLAVAAEFGGRFGRVEDEWSLEQIWSELRKPLDDTTPVPQWLSWFTYLGAERRRVLAPVLDRLGADVLEMRGGAALVRLLDDPAAVDPVRFAQLHHEYRRAVRRG